MQHRVYVQAPTGILELIVESETPPDNREPNSDYSMVTVGGNMFPRRSLIAIVREDQFKSRGTLAAPK
jgi:hypothetical protein